MKRSIDKAALLEAIFENSEETIIIVSLAGEILDINSGGLKLFEYDKEELLGQKIEVLIPERFRPNHGAYREDYAKSPENRAMGVGLELRGRKKDGSEFPVSVGLSKAQVAGETIVVGFVIDITFQTEVRERLKQVNNELEERVRERTMELARMVNQLEDTNEKLQKAEIEVREALMAERELSNMKSRFVSMASHEFRTPLSTILSSISLVEKYQEADQQQKREKHINRVKSNVKYLTNILNDFLSMDKLQTGKIMVQPEPFKLNDFLVDVCEEMHDLLKPGQYITQELDCDEQVVLDPKLLRTILSNLVSNAIKYSSENDEIILRLSMEGEYVVMRVKDHGIGIPLEEQEHIFERFFRAKNVINIQGTGLGLNLTRGIAELMNGSLDFESEYEKGSIFTITLPKKIES